MSGTKTAARLRRIRAENPGWSTAKNVAWESKNPEKRSAHREVEYAIKTGKLFRQPCERCGEAERVQAHHDDYSKPFEIMWLCQRHHRERHRELAAQTNSEVA